MKMFWLQTFETGLYRKLSVCIIYDCINSYNSCYRWLHATRVFTLWKVYLNILL